MTWVPGTPLQNLLGGHVCFALVVSCCAIIKEFVTCLICTDGRCRVGATIYYRPAQTFVFPPPPPLNFVRSWNPFFETSPKINDVCCCILLQLIFLFRLCGANGWIKQHPQSMWCSHPWVKFDQGKSQCLNFRGSWPRPTPDSCIRRIQW